jgi:tyrosyl-tRNA synthetase
MEARWCFRAVGSEARVVGVTGGSPPPWQADVMVDAGFVEDLKFRGLWYQEAGTRLTDRLSAAPITAYIGFDPTSESLHVGSLLQICMLRRLQLAGHHPIALAGGGTGMVGDPGGKSEERALLDDEQLRANLEGIESQLRRFLDLDADHGAGRALLLDNSRWLRELKLLEFLRDIGKHFSVNEMIRRESVMTRLERPEHGISFTEFSYMLLQAYDYLHLFDEHDCRLQIGGSDQYGNILMGVELVRKLRRNEVYGLTSPLVLKADGTKFGKSEAGTVWLDATRTSVYQFYQFFLRTEDAVVSDYLRYFTFLDHDSIRRLDEARKERPEEREAQRALAHEVCVLVHGEDETRRAEQAAAALFSGRVDSLDEPSLLEVFAEAPSTALDRSDLDGAGTDLVDLLVATEVAGSKGAARRLVSQGGVYVNGQRVTDQASRLTRADLLHDCYLVLRRGKQDYHLVRFR